MSTESPAAGEAQVRVFQRDGVVVLRGILTGGEVATLARGVERNLADLGPLGMNATGPGSPARSSRTSATGSASPSTREAIQGSRLPAAAGALMRSREVRLFHDHLLVKEAGTRDRSPWHQDQPYYCIDGSQTVSFWIPLDPVARPSTLEFVAGSHAEGRWFMPRSFVKGTPMVFEDGALAEVPDIEADRGAWDIKGWELEPGDAVAFNMLTLHGAAGSPSRRRAFSLRLVGDDVRFAPRPHRTSPPFDELDGVLAPARRSTTRCSRCSGAARRGGAVVRGRRRRRLVRSGPDRGGAAAETFGGRRRATSAAAGEERSGSWGPLPRKRSVVIPRATSTAAARSGPDRDGASAETPAGRRRATSRRQ